MIFEFVAISTTPEIAGYEAVDQLGLITGEVVRGTNFLRDMLAGLTDTFGGRSTTYEKQIERATQEALDRMAERAAALDVDAVVGVRITHQFFGNGRTGGMLMATAVGTGVKLRKREP